MKLLFDQNLSPTLVMRLADLFPDASHVQAIDLDCASDDRVCVADIKLFEEDIAIGTLVLS